jgi:uncharacterized protein YndB with AHSA1/START domain
MSLLKKSLIFFATLFLGLIVIGFLLPSHYKVERSVIINAPQHQIFPHISNLKNWQNWGVWFKRDPNISLVYSGEIGRVGMKSQWVSDNQGNGEMQILAVEDNRRLIYSLYVDDAEMTSTGEFVLSKVEQGTKVVWMDYGDVGNNPISRYFAFFMDYLIGSDFEMGLENLKLVVEAS